MWGENDNDMEAFQEFLARIENQQHRLIIL